MNENYADILTRSWDDIPTPKVLPVGTWLLRGKNVALFPPKEEGQSLRVAFFYQAKEPMADVKQEELDTLGEDYAYSENDIVKQFFVNRNKDWDGIRRHLALHGIDTAGKSQKETFDAFKGAEVLAFLGTRTYTNGAGQSVTDNDPTSFGVVS
jgi:hypothetical protein